MGKYIKKKIEKFLNFFLSRAFFFLEFFLVFILFYFFMILILFKSFILYDSYILYRYFILYDPYPLKIFYPLHPLKKIRVCHRTNRTEISKKFLFGSVLKFRWCFQNLNEIFLSRLTPFVRADLRETGVLGRGQIWVRQIFGASSRRQFF